MAQIEETPLPGVGVRYDFKTQEGQRVGVIHHRSGRREVFVCAPGDPDTVRATLTLSTDEARTLVDLLGGSKIVENLAHLQQRVEGLAIDWLEIAPESPYSGRTMGEAAIRTRTGVSIVAVLRNDTTFPAPSPDFLIEADDTLVVVGTPEGISMVGDILLTG